MKTKTKKPAKKTKKPVKKTKKAASVKKATAPKVRKAKPIGKITHYFSEIKVAVVKLSAPLKEGDQIRITGGEETDFTQAVKSMQIDHKPVKAAKKGNSIGLKIKEKAREGYLVFKA